MKKILVLCPYPENKAPSQRLKYEQYFSHFREDGFHIDVRPFMSLRFWNIAYRPGNTLQKLLVLIQSYLRRIATLFIIHRYDVVYVHLWVTPFGPPIFEWLVSKLAKRMVYDIDDLVYIKNEKADKWYTGILKGRKKPIFLMKKADHVITCTPYLDEFVRKYNQHTTDISSTINTDNYIPANSYSNNERLTLGWSGSHSTARYLHLLRPVLLELRKQADFKLLVMGSKDFVMEGIDTEVYEWSEEREIPTLQRIDIGLYPLPTDEQWVYGKSGLKALQYMALGIPTVATAIGANFRIIQNGENGFLVNSHEEWLQTLRRLIDDPALRREVGMKARERVENNYSIKVNAPVYLRILNGVLEKK